jgi:hypothetical protein
MSTMPTPVAAENDPLKPDALPDNGFGHWLTHWVLLAPIPIWIALVGTILTDADLLTRVIIDGALVVYAIACAASHRDELLADRLSVNHHRFFAGFVRSFATIIEIIGALTVTYLTLSSWISTSKYRGEALAKVLTVKTPEAITINVLLALSAAIVSLVVVTFRVMASRG